MLDTFWFRREGRVFCCDDLQSYELRGLWLFDWLRATLDRIESAHYDCFPSGHTEMTILAWWGSGVISPNLFRAMFALHFGCNFCYSLPTLPLHGRCTGRRPCSRRLNLDDTPGLSSAGGQEGRRGLVSEITVVGADDRGTFRQFIEFPYQHYKNDRYWVPPLRIAQKDMLDKKKHPFYAHAEMQLFAGDAMARSPWDESRRFSTGISLRPIASAFSDFSRLIDSQPVADALFRAAWDWLKQRGAKSMRGPVNPSTNYECGLLVEGFDSSPMVMMTYNPPYYSKLIERAGFKKIKDLLAYITTAPATAGHKAMRVAERAARASKVAIRQVNMKNFRSRSGHHLGYL